MIWCGNAPNQKALAVKIAKEFSVAGIVIEKKTSGAKKENVAQLIHKIWDRIKFRSIYNAWKNLQQFYAAAFVEWPSVPVLTAANINTKEVYDFTNKLSPDLIIVSGTSLIKQLLLDIPAIIGIINLHTGLSPYVKGGPNCTNWCIANNDWHLVGNTIMWINAGIDSGNIITTERIDIRNSDSLYTAQKMVMEHAHELYIKTIRYLNDTNSPYQSVAQTSLPAGRLYYTKMWNATTRSLLLKNWRKRKDVIPVSEPVTIKLPVQ